MGLVFLEDSSSTIKYLIWYQVVEPSCKSFYKPTETYVYTITINPIVNLVKLDQLIESEQQRILSTLKPHLEDNSK